MTRDVYCPLCKYNLRLLSQPRCPECGYRFTWSEVLVQLDLHPYLFEHHPEKPVRSCVRTFLAAWCPRRFWSSVRPSQVLDARRLLIYAIAGTGALLVVFTAAFAIGAAVLQAKQEIATGRFWWRFTVPALARGVSSGNARTVQANPSFLDVLWAVLWGPTFVSDTWSDCVRFFWPLAFVVPVVWAISTLLTLLTLRISMRRARIRPVHMLRCTLYSFDLLAWAAILAVVAAGLPWLMTMNVANTNMPSRGYGPGPLEYPIVFGVLICVLMSAWRLWRALSLYLRFDHPMATVAASQVIAFLASNVAIAAYTGRLSQDLHSWFR
jgi:hypothetical protein